MTACISIRLPDEGHAGGLLSGQKFLLNLLAGTGIEPATQGFSVLCSTD